MKNILLIILVLASANSFAQNTWVKWGGHIFLKQGNDSTYWGDDAVLSTLPTIVSSSSIKTINGNTLLGSGNLVIGGSTSWGGITGTLSDQTDLQTALNLKLAANGNGSSLTGLTASQVGLGNVTNESKATMFTSPTFTGTVSGVTSSMVGLGNVNNTSDANKPISTATQTALDGKQSTLVSATNIKTINGGSILGSGDLVVNGSGVSRVFLPNDVINNNAVANTIQDVTGLSFPVVANTTYKFKFVIIYNSAATTTGSRWCINGPATTHMSFTSQYPTTATALTINPALAGYNLPAASNASSLTTNNRAIIEGEIRPSADGTVIARFASEILNSAITAVASGRSYVEYQIIN